MTEISQNLRAISMTKWRKSQIRRINMVQRTIPELDHVHNTATALQQVKKRVTCILYMHNLVHRTIDLSISIQLIYRKPTARRMPRKPGFYR